MKKLSVLANKNIMGLIIAVLVTLIGFIMAGNIVFQSLRLPDCHGRQPGLRPDQLSA
jgi:hypothetical protein